MMRSIELTRFSAAVVMVMEDMFLTALKNGDFKKLSQVKNYNNKTETTLITQKPYNDFQYIFKLDEMLTVYRIQKNKVDQQEMYREHIMTTLLTNPAQLEKLKVDGGFQTMASYQFYISSMSNLKQMMVDLNLNHFDDKYHYFEEDMATYNFGFKNDIDVVFEAGKHFNRKLTLGSDCFNKHVFGDKEVISYTSTSAGVTTFILYERDMVTGHIRIFEDLEDNVDEEQFPHDTIIIGRYPKIVQHYIENTAPCVVIENDVILKNENPHVVLTSSVIAYTLADEYSIKKRVPYDVTSLASVMDYMVIDNINLLYTYGLWSSDAKWKKNEHGRYYLELTEDMLATRKRGTAMVHGSKSYGYITEYRFRSPMNKIPETGEIEPEWLDLVVKSFTFVSKYRKKLDVCEVTEKDLKAVEAKLLARNCI